MEAKELLDRLERELAEVQRLTEQKMKRNPYFRLLIEETSKTNRHRR